ncbi:FAM195 domain containing protein [Asbolus verrucosus]|uniref:FAM195 domain containing protein n=1 Tax=Asbolus verrucosus TaxID=1661398 RepID=A0A482V488_ASBVE|nr:FAM195 domain containing protein [Asbolus verrucosus]
MSQMNGNRRPTNLNRIPSNEKPVCSQHDDLIKYICDSWNKVSQEVDRNTGTTVIYYQEQEHHNLKDFEPFDLEGFCGRREMQNFQQPHNS